MEEEKRITVYVGLGSNLGDSRTLLAQTAEALAALPGVALVRLSPVYRTEPQGRKDQPFFLNQAAELSCPAGMVPEELLDMLQAIEARLGRERSREGRFGPRTMDLDLLLFGNKGMKSRRLVLPHPRMRERAFVLVPLADIAPNVRLPGGQSVAEACRALVFSRQGDVICQ